jgi:hypothetical protein
MAELPTFISTAQAPRTTGVGSPTFVENVDPMGKTLQTVGKKGKSIADEMFETRAVQAVNHAKLGATLKLNNLTTELGKMDPAEAMRIAPGRIQEIYNQQTEGMSDVARQAFDTTFMTLNGQAQTNIQTQAIKNHNDQQQAGLVILLDGLKKTHDPINNPLSTGEALATADAAIAAAVNGRNITREEGVKTFLKFRKEIAEQGVDKWLNTQTADTLMDAYSQMDTGVFENKDGTPNPVIKKLWDELDEKQKGEMRRKAAREFSRLGAQVDKAERLRLQKLNQAGKTDIRIIYNPNSTQVERDAAIARVEKNTEVSNSDFKQMLDDVGGRTDRFNDTSIENNFYKRIIKDDQTLTIKEILNADNINFGTKSKLIAALEASEKEEMKRAAEIIRSHPLFVPKTKADAMLNSNQMNAAQATLYNQIYSQFVATPKDQNFDAVGETNKAIRNLINNGGANAITDQVIRSAQQRLKALNITDEQSAINYIATKNPSMEIRNQITQDLQIIKSAGP